MKELCKAYMSNENWGKLAAGRVQEGDIILLRYPSAWAAKAYIWRWRRLENGRSLLVLKYMKTQFLIAALENGLWNL